MSAPIELSVVVPLYNEADVLPLLVARLRPVLDGIGAPYEVLTVDDGSVDASPVLLQRYRREWPALRVVRLRANSGHQAAISAGLARARGAYVVTIDADLQDPPEAIATMLEVARAQKVDVVYGVRSDRRTDCLLYTSPLPDPAGVVGCHPVPQDHQAPGRAGHGVGPAGGPSRSGTAGQSRHSRSNW